MNTMFPIGSVVELKESHEKLVIIGYLHQDTRGNNIIISQYTGCEYSLGLDDKMECYYFSEEDIENVYFMGYAIESDRVFLRLLYELYNEISNNSNFDVVINRLLDKYYADDEKKKKEILDKTFSQLFEGGDNNE